MDERAQQPVDVAMADESRPYLSVVVTARNDDHGGNLLRRMQTFVNALIAQAVRYDVPLELVLVDWNPPQDRPKLAEAIRWPAEIGDCALRVIETPPQLHARYVHSDRLPLYQMIAKNAGIRRATGKFILATNIDIVFSNEFFEFLSQRALRPGSMYRLDRYDVASDVPVDGSADERLAYCESHLLRLNTREGTFPIASDGRPVLASADIVARDSGIFFGYGWYEPEQYFGRVFRWAAPEAGLILKPPPGETRALVLELEPGPGTDVGGLRLQVLNEDGEPLGEGEVYRKTLVRIQYPLEAARTCLLRLRMTGSGARVGNDPRVLGFRVFHCAWEDCKKGSRETVTTRPASLIHGGPLVAATRACSRISRGLSFLGQLPRASRPLRIGLPIPPKVLEKLQVRLDPSGLSFALFPSRLGAGQVSRLRAPASRLTGRNIETSVHTNACGDFTLLAREDWFDLRGYPELDLFSLHLDSLFCFAARSGGLLEEVLRDPVRIYHIEHEIGSGWTPEGAAKMFERLAAKGLPWIEYSQVVAWADSMWRLGAPMIFNRGNWGLADFNLPERRGLGRPVSGAQDSG